MGDNGNRQQSWILEMYLQLKLTNIKNGPYAGVQNKEESGMTPEFFGSGQERTLMKMTTEQWKEKVEEQELRCNNSQAHFEHTRLEMPLDHWKYPQHEREEIDCRLGIFNI